MSSLKELVEEKIIQVVKEFANDIRNLDVNAVKKLKMLIKVGRLISNEEVFKGLEKFFEICKGVKCEVVVNDEGLFILFPQNYKRDDVKLIFSKVFDINSDCFEHGDAQVMVTYLNGRYGVLANVEISYIVYKILEMLEEQMETNFLNSLRSKILKEIEDILEKHGYDPTKYEIHVEIKPRVK